MHVQDMALDQVILIHHVSESDDRDNRLQADHLLASRI
jgi:hypothetical protein